MTLRLRRGLDIDRQGIVFAEGELVYTTDTKQIYIGDGSTVGGVRVTGASDGSPPELTQNLNLNGYNISGTGTISATSFTGDGSGLTDLPLGGNLTVDLNLDSNNITGSGNININGTINALSFAGDGSGLTGVSGSFIDGLEYDIDVRGNIIGSNSSIIVDYNTNTFNGNFVGDGSQLTNIPTPDINYGSYIINLLSGDGNTVILDSATSVFNGIFVGDGSQLSNLPGLSFIEGQEYSIDVRGNVLGFSSTVLIDAFTETITAEALTGHANIDVSGSIYGYDSTLIIDSLNSVLSIDSANINSLSYGGSFGLTLNSSETDEVEVRIFRRTPLPDTLAQVGILYFDSVLNDDVESTTAYIQSLGSQNLGDPYAKSFLEFNVIDETGTVSENNVLILSWDGKAGFGTYDPTERLDVRGNGIFTGTVTAASFKGSIVADDSTTIVDAINGTISASGFIQFGSYTDTEITEITPSNGMVYYNTTDNRFRGFQNGSWINLDDGTSA
jgi:hypothetical protein